MPQYIGTVYLDVRADTSRVGGDLSRTMAGAGAAAGAAGGAAMTQSLSKKLLQFGTQATRIGRQISFGLSAPLIALGAKSEQAFIAYDTQLTKVAALTGTGIAQTSAWSDEILNLGSEFGVSGEDAAKALYLITSSGIKGQAAMDTLRTTLKATATGLGDSATVAGLLTSAINAYGEANLPAAKAADILTGAVQESKIPADQLAGSISNLLPFGTQLGVSFAQITGAMAALSLQGTNAAQAATQLRGIFNGLLDPSTQAAQALTRLGLNAEGLRDTLAKEGIVPVLQRIRDAIVSHGGEADSELAEIFGNVRALTGAFGLLNEEGGKVQRVMDNTTNSVGKLDKAFLVTADTAGFKARQATEGLHNETIKLGESLAPVAAFLLGAARAGLEFIDALGPARPIVIGLGVALAAIGPLTYSIGAASSLIGGLSGAFGLVTASATAASIAELEATAAATAAAAADTALAVAAGTASAASLSLAEGAAAAALAELATAQAAALATGPVAAFGAVATAALAPIAALVAGAAAAWVIWNKAMEVGQTHVDLLSDTLSNKLAGGGIADAQKTINELSKSMNELIDEAQNDNLAENFVDADYYKTLGDAVDVARKKIEATNTDITRARELAAKTGGNADTIFQWLANERNANRTYKTNEEALTAYTAAMVAHGDAAGAAAAGTANLADKAKELKANFFGATNAQRSYDDAITKVADAQRAAADAGQAVIDAHQAEVDAVAKVADAQDKHREALEKVADAQKKLIESQSTLAELSKGPTLDEQLDVKQAQLALRRAQAGLRKPGQDPLDRQQGRLDIQRAKIALTEARGAHDKNLAKAQEDVASAQSNLTAAQKDAVGAARAIGDAERGVADAHRGVEKAQRDAIKATEDIGRAQQDAVGAADTLAQKNADLANAIIAAKDGAQPLIGYLSEMKGLYPDIGGAIDVYLEKAKALEAFFHPPQAPPPPPPPPPVSPEVQQQIDAGLSGLGRALGRATGGPLSSGQLSTVNELGLPELWSQGGKQYLLPLRAGHVTPLHPAEMPVKGGDGFTVGDINVYEQSGRPRQTAYEVRRELRKEAFLAGRRS